MAVFRTNEERNWMIKKIPDMEKNKETKIELIQFLSGESKSELKIKTPYNFSRIMESVKKGHPSMSSKLKSVLYSITDVDCQKYF